MEEEGSQCLLKRGNRQRRECAAIAAAVGGTVDGWVADDLESREWIKTGVLHGFSARSMASGSHLYGEFRLRFLVRRPDRRKVSIDNSQVLNNGPLSRTGLPSCLRALGQELLASCRRSLPDQKCPGILHEGT